ncbi:MAG: MFS transporter [Pseudomonadota bacterium]
MANKPAALTLKTLLGYGALGLPLAALNLPLYVYLPAFYAEDIGLGLTTVGLLLFAARLLDTFTDPIIGELGDRTRTRFGRRRPWMVAACPLLIVATLMLFIPGEGAGAAYLFFWTTLAYLAWTMMILPFTALGAELSGDYHERSRITGAREGFVVVGIILAAALPIMLGLDADNQRGEILAVLGWSMALLTPLALAGVLIFAPEPKTSLSPSLPLKEGLRLAWNNRPFLRLIAAYLLNGIANGLPATLFFLFVGDVLGGDGASGPLLLLYFVAGIIGIPIWLRISKVIGKHRAWAAAMLWASAMFVWAPFLGEGDLVAFTIICALSGLSLGADMALPASIQADVVDLDSEESGQQRTGLFFALWSMATKLSLALAIGIAFPLLDLIGYEAGGENAPSALLGLAMLYGLLPVIIKLAATALVWRFPIDQTEQAERRQRLDESRQRVPTESS